MKRTMLVEHYAGDYYKIVSVGDNGHAYEENQKIITKFNWISGKIKSELMWNDRAKEVIEIPIAIKNELQMKALLKHKNLKLLKNIYKLISESSDFNDFRNRVEAVCDG